MDGQDEGLFGWVTINYLLDALHQRADRTSTVLDLGGGSTQIAMSVASSGGQLVASTFMGKTHNMFLHSFLGFGLMAGRGKVLGHLVPPGDPRRTGQAEILTACVPRGAAVEFHYGDDVYRAKGKPDASFEACSMVSSAAIKSDTTQFSSALPRPAAGQPVVALSYYFDRAMDVGLVTPGAQEGSVTPLEYMEAARRVCALSVDELRHQFPSVDEDTAAFLCLDLCFIGSLLVDGVGLDPHARMMLAKSMQYNGERVETQWSLGASLAEIFETQTALGVHH